MGKCTACDEEFFKRDKLNKNLDPKPENYVLLYSQETVDAHEQRVATMEPRKDDSMEPMCPECGDRNADDFVFDAQSLRENGFSPVRDAGAGFSERDTAENGICTARSCISEHGGHRFGVPLIPRKEWEVKEDERYADWEAVADEKRAGNEPGETGNQRGDAYFILRKQYADALEGRRAIVDPPYYYTSGENPFSRPNGRQENGVPDEANRMISAKHSDDWFNCLETYLWALVKVEGFRHEHLTAAAYLDKTFRRGHVEPLWLYASERNGVGNNIERAFVIASQKSSIFEEAIKPNMHVLEPSRDSIQVVYRMIKASFGNLWPFFANQTEALDEADCDAGLIEQAIAAWQRFEKWQFYGKFWDVPMLRAPYDVNGLMTAAPGLVESLCILWSVKQKNPANYKEIRNNVFPDGPSYWRKMLTDEGIAMVDRLETVVLKQMDE
tara:strand:+ start:1365 stop:2687 length:1323 start_codon:yes stop_codon:yes gene_type:complete